MSSPTQGSTTERPPLPQDLRFAYFLHQDKVLWSRLQTLMTAQAAAFVVVLALRHDSVPAFVAFAIAIIVSLFIALLSLRDLDYREYHQKILAAHFKDGEIYLEKEPRLKLAGRALFWIIVGVFGAADVLLALAVGYGWIH